MGWHHVAQLKEWQRMSPPGFLPTGTHTLEFRFLTDTLDLLGPYSRSVTVSTSPDKQIRHLISLLASGPDDRRAAAVTGLARQPARALPALRLALKKSPGDWWLRVAIQEAEAEAAPRTSIP